MNFQDEADELLQTILLHKNLFIDREAALKEIADKLEGAYNKGWDKVSIKEEVLDRRKLCHECKGKSYRYCGVGEVESFDCLNCKGTGIEPEVKEASKDTGVMSPKEIKEEPKRGPVILEKIKE